MPERIGNDLTGIILTGGQATRMRPLSLDCSKSMMPFLGQPLLAYLLRDIASAGMFQKVFLTHPGKNNDIRLHFGDGENCGIRVEYCASRRWTGSAGVVMTVLAESEQPLSSPVLVVYGDSLLRMDYRALIDFHLQKGASMTIACHRPRFDAFLFEADSSDRPRTNFGVADLQPSGFITHFEEKPCLDTIASSFSHPVANAAAYVIDPRVLQAVQGSSISDLDFGHNVIPWLIANGKRVAGLDIAPGFRVDIGTLSNYLSLQIAMLKGHVQMPGGADIFLRSPKAAVDPGAHLVPPFLVGDGARIHDDAVVHSSVIGDRVIIQAGARISDSVILADAVVGANAIVTGSILGPHTQISDGVILPRGTVTGAWSRIGGPELVLPQEAVRGLFIDESEGRK